MGLVMSVEEIVEAALKLDPKTRRELVEKIAASLKAEEIPEMVAAELWVAEAERRASELDGGAAQAIPADAVMARLRALRA